MLFVLPVWVTRLACVTVIALALIRGGTVERIVGATLLAFFTYGLTHTEFYGAHPLHSLIENSLFAAIMLGVALKANRYWTIPAAALMVLKVLTDVAQLLTPISGWAVGTAQLTWYYGFFICLGVGVLTMPRRIGPPISLGGPHAPAAQGR